MNVKNLQVKSEQTIKIIQALLKRTKSAAEGLNLSEKKLYVANILLSVEAISSHSARLGCSTVVQKSNQNNESEIF